MKGNSVRILLLLLFLLLLGSLGYWWLSTEKNNPVKAWEGSWEITYFYENEPELLYKGTLILSFEDSLAGSLEVFAPMSRRSELLELSSLSLTGGGKKLFGQARHTGYKINEGNLQESFELRLEEAGRLSGSGSCMAYCAEGTEGVSISWEGFKSEITSTKNQ